MTTYDQRLHPVLKWPGGKRQLLNPLLKEMPQDYQRYYEPFLGGGALCLAVRPDHAVLNDANAALVNLYRQIQTNALAVISAVKALDAVPCDAARYSEVREAYNAKLACCVMDVETAAMLLWLSRHGYNGLYRVNSKGIFNVPYNQSQRGTNLDEENLLELHEYLSSEDVSLVCGDFETACEDAGANDFVYFDPPYASLGNGKCFTAYTKEGFTEADQRRLSALFRRLDAQGALLMLSNHDTPLIRELYAGFHFGEVEARRSISRNSAGRRGREVIITNAVLHMQP